MAKDVEMIQVKLEAPLTEGRKSTLVTWVTNDKKIVPGATMTLKEIEDTRWTVVEVYDLVQSKEEVESNRNWDNNNYDKHDTRSLKERTK